MKSGMHLDLRKKSILQISFTLIIFILVSIPANATVYKVTDDTQLSASLLNAKEGDFIYVAAGNYSKISITTPSLTIVGEDIDSVIFDNDGDSIEFEADNCVLQGVTIKNSDEGIIVNADHCEIRDCIFEGITNVDGIDISGDYTIFENNTIANATGINLAVCGKGDNCIYRNNLFINNSCSALALFTYSANNEVTQNRFINNTCGVHLWKCLSGNRIYLNDFINNDDSIKTQYFYDTISWNSEEQLYYIHNNTQLVSYLGNYWSDYNGTDNNDDGIGDSAYEVSTSLGTDGTPLLSGFANYTLEANETFVDLVPIEFSLSFLVAEQPNRLRVNVKNAGNGSSSFCYAELMDGEEVLESQIVEPMEAGEISSVVFTFLPDEGSHDLTFRIDPDDTISEIDESNNDLTSILKTRDAYIDANWYQFHKDVKHTGFYPGDAPDTSELLWVSGDINAIPDSSTVIAEGKVFVNVNGTGSMSGADPSSDSEILALDAYTGKVVDSYGVGSSSYGSWATPCYYNGNVSCAQDQNAVNGGNMIVNGKIYCGDYEGCSYHCYYECNGTEIWKFTTPGSPDYGLASGAKVQSCPAYSDGKIYVGSMPKGYMNDYGLVHCVDAETGEEIWNTTVWDDMCTSPSIYNDIVYVTTYEWYGYQNKGQLYAIDKDDGTIIWTQDIERTDSTPAFAYGNVYVTGGCVGYSLIDTYCFDAITGEKKWAISDYYYSAGWFGDGGWTQSPIVADGKVYFGTPSGMFNYYAINCVDAYTGEAIWRNGEVDDSGYILSIGGGGSPSISDGILYTIGEDGKVYAYGDLSHVNSSEANFEANILSGEAPLTVEFTDNSINASSWQWDFDTDYLTDSTEQNPIYTYDEAGIYTVGLTVSGNNDIDSETKVAYIVVTAGEESVVDADFSANSTYGQSPLAVKFTDQSVNASSWQWDFDNDGTVDSTEQNPVYVYTETGTYAVTLNVSDSDGVYDIETKTGYIIISSSDGPELVADFSANITSGQSPLIVEFTDLSTGEDISSWKWDFDNDGTVDSTEQNPVYTYGETGTYSVKLLVSNGENSDSETKSWYIIVGVEADWNPWNDPDTVGSDTHPDDGKYIGDREIQEAINCWVEKISAPTTGADIDYIKMQALAYHWVNDLEMEEGTI